VKFCPECGQARLGKFCGSCGFAFSKEEISTPSESSGSWLDDPSDPTQQRFWDGSSWTNLTRPIENAATLAATKKALLKKLVYGPEFDSERQCSNCGKSFGRSKACSNCED
jgi:ribosomal protein L32